MTKLNEDSIEMMAVAALEKLDYRYFYGPDIAPTQGQSRDICQAQTYWKEYLADE